MKYQWSDYTKEYSALVESWLDDEAINLTGMDDGWEEFYEYWKNEPDMSLGENYWCKVISEQGVPFAVIALTLYEGKLTVMEYLVDSGRRNLGLGSSALCELMESGLDIIGSDTRLAEAVIFPNNKPSQRAFEKAGFKFSSANPDRDAWYYRYEKQKI